VPGYEILIRKRNSKSAVYKTKKEFAEIKIRFAEIKKEFSLFKI
jgi:hypothetical protein